MNAPITPPEFNPTDDVGFVRVDQIVMGDRLRPVDEAWANALGLIMQRDGQRTPIEICRHPFDASYTLVSGAHRLRGAQIVGLEHIKATVISSASAETKIAEISENLFHSTLAPIDRAVFVAELVALLKVRAGIDPTKDGRAISAAVRWQKAVQQEGDDTTARLATAYGFADDVGDAIGLSARTVRNDMLLYRRLSPIAVDALRSVRHAILDNASQLAALAKQDPKAQQEIVAALLGTAKRFVDRPAKSVSEALSRIADKKAAPAEEKRLNAFIGTYSRMSLAEKKGALAALAEMLPAGWSLTEGGAK